jgi:hypothetical protein
MIEPRLFVLAPEAFHCQATFVAGAGWRLRVGMRRQGESWSDAALTEYSHLSTAELLDVICAEASRHL